MEGVYRRRVARLESRGEKAAARLRHRKKVKVRREEGRPPTAALFRTGGLTDRGFDQLPEIFTIVNCVLPSFSFADCVTVTEMELAPFWIVTVPPALVVMVCALGPAFAV